MATSLVCLLILSIALSDLNCQSNQVYVKVVKQSVSYSSEESYQIYNGETLLVTSPSIPDNSLHSAEYCLEASTNSQYTIKLVDSYGDSWSAGAYVYVQGIYGNIVFKNFMNSRQADVYPLSLYYAVSKNDEWKLTSGSVSGSWTEAGYNDASWDNVYLGFVSTAVSGTQYFRKSISGFDFVAAYELAMYYRQGIIAYLNGVEIYRDNMPAGEVTSQTAATGQYSSLSAHRIIRPGSEVMNTSILAVEIHFISNQLYVDFDAYLSYNAASIADTKCYIYPDDLTLSSDVSSIENIRDFKKSTRIAISSDSLPSSVGYALKSEHPQGMFNGIAVWPNTDIVLSPHSFVFQGANSASPEEWNNILEAESAVYTSQTMREFLSFVTPVQYSNYRVLFETASEANIYVFEMLPLICNIAIPTSIEFSQSTYTAVASYEPIQIKPIVKDIANCQISPSPLPGLTFDSATCTLSGASTQSTTGTVYTLTATLAGNTLTGSFTLVVNQCNGVFTQFLRTYKDNAAMEGFNVIDHTTQQNILTVELNSVTIGNQDWSAYLCLTNSKYEIETFTSEKAWADDSYLYVRAYFDLDNYETILRVRRDDDLAIPVDYFFNIQYSIHHSQNWYYKMGEVPANWYNSEVSGWTEKPSSGYPDSTNQIQLYKKQFTVASLEGMAGVVISLKYQYGAIIYLNGNEVFRNRVEGDLSTESYAASSYSTLKFHQISLPLSGNYKTSSFTNFITTGTNTIAVALVSTGPTIVSSTFDCAVRLMGDETVLRNHDYTVSYTGNIQRLPKKVFDLVSNYDMYANGCADAPNRFVDLSFNDDRREWLSSISIQGQRAQFNNYPYGFDLYGRNTDDEEWSLIKRYYGLNWSLQNQRQRYWTLSTNSFSQYRFGNFSGIPGDELCVWKLGSIQLIRDSTSGVIPPLDYEDTVIFKEIEMAELYPNSDYYTDFTVNPPLPEGISIDFHSGVITGTPKNTQDAVTYTVTAKRFSGETATCTFTLSVVICDGEKALITLMAHTDTYAREMGFKIYSGKDTTGTLIRNVDKMKVNNAHNFYDYCLDFGMYTYQFTDTYFDGWSSPAGYYLSVDSEQLKFGFGLVARREEIITDPTFTFSSYLPFQGTYSEWSVLKNAQSVASNWNSINFDASSWTVMKAGDLGTNDVITTYLRHEVNIENPSDFNVFNLRIRYVGGVVAYFNGRKVARFNLAEFFDANTESLTMLNNPAIAKFHIILETSGVVSGKNMMAFEIHRSLGQSSSQPITFDATGIFDVNDCAIAIDSYTRITGTPSSDGASLSSLFDFIPNTIASPTNEIETYIEWTVDNLEGTKFNTVALEVFTNVNDWGFSVYGRFSDEDTYVTVFEGTGLSTVSRIRSKFDAPVAIANFKQFKMQYDYPASTTSRLTEIISMYCRLAGEGVCPGIDEYPPVGEGQISPGNCPEGYRGYSYRECHNGVLGEIKTDKCDYKIPVFLKYGSERYALVKDTQVKIAAPTYQNIITEFYLAPNVQLPKGLTLDVVTGAITGSPSEVVSLVTYTIYGKNPAGAVETEISFSIRMGECKAAGDFPNTMAGETAVFECSTYGSYVGTQKRSCILGETDGEWSKVTGTCLPVFLVVIGILIMIFVLAVIILLAIRLNISTKRVGGVKSKKTLSKTPATAPTTKEVKI